MSNRRADPLFPPKRVSEAIQTLKAYLDEVDCEEVTIGRTGGVCWRHGYRLAEKYLELYDKATREMRHDQGIW